MIVLVFDIYPNRIYFNIRPPELLSVLMALVYDPLPLSNNAHTIIFCTISPSHLISDGERVFRWCILKGILKLLIDFADIERLVSVEIISILIKFTLNTSCPRQEYCLLAGWACNPFSVRSNFHHLAKTTKRTL